MPRSPRVVIPEVPVHVIQRGHNRAPTFRCADDFRRYRETLFEACQRVRCAIHAYVFMTNHAHLLITPEDRDDPARIMQAIGRRYVRYVNKRHRRTGALWEGRFRSSVIHSERYLFVCSRYIELNPVRAAMVHDPDQYRWSSFGHNAYGEPDELITPHASYLTLGSSAEERQTFYRALFEDPLDARTVDDIRRAVNQGTALREEELVST